MQSGDMGYTQHNGGIRDREIRKSIRLLCCSRPTSELVVEL